MKKGYQIIKKFQMQDGGLCEIPLPYIIMNKKVAEKIVADKKLCSDINVMCEDYLL